MSFSILKNTAAVAGLACAISFVSATAVSAEGRLCGKRDQVISQLQSVHGESRQSVGLQPNARVMETFANPDTGTWTIIVSLPTGMSCLVAAGEAYQAEAKGAFEPAVEEDPA